MPGLPFWPDVCVFSLFENTASSLKIEAMEVVSCCSCRLLSQFAMSSQAACTWLPVVWKSALWIFLSGCNQADIPTRHRGMCGNSPFSHIAIHISFFYSLHLHICLIIVHCHCYRHPPQYYPPPPGPLGPPLWGSADRRNTVYFMPAFPTHQLSLPIRLRTKPGITYLFNFG